MVTNKMVTTGWYQKQIGDKHGIVTNGLVTEMDWRQIWTGKNMEHGTWNMEQ